MSDNDRVSVGVPNMNEMAREALKEEFDKAQAARMQLQLEEAKRAEAKKALAEFRLRLAAPVAAGLADNQQRTAESIAEEALRIVDELIKQSGML